MTSEQIAESRREAEAAGWVRLTAKGPESYGWCGYTVMRYRPREWWGYLFDRGLGISMPSKEKAQEYCENHYDERMGDEPRRGDVA